MANEIKEKQQDLKGIQTLTIYARIWQSMFYTLLSLIKQFRRQQFTLKTSPLNNSGYSRPLPT